MFSTLHLFYIIIKPLSKNLALLVPKKKKKENRLDLTTPQIHYKHYIELYIYIYGRLLVAF
ncbi:unnamed protein product [Coffea canephora]|uniref:Uncharacterized protein n=1 Tax=Coffea canephora TaxID=49390 RepID=A0A068U2F7_COFCA|nr:unnamed protein product [Coffea canephora]